MFCVALLRFIRGQRLDADGELVIRLIREVVIATTRLDGDARGTSLTGRIDELDRGSEILHIQPNAQGLRQLCLGEGDANLATLLFDVRADRWIRQGDDDVTCSIVPTAKIDVTDGLALHRCRSRLGDRSGYRSNGCRSGCTAFTEHHEKIVAIDTGRIRHQRGEIDDQTSPPLSFHHRYAARVTDTQLTVLRIQLAGDAGKVQCDARRLIERIAARCSDGLVESQLQLHPIPRQRGNVQGVEVGSQQSR